MINDPKLKAILRGIMPKSRHGCTNPTCLASEYKIENTTEEIVAVQRFFNISSVQAANVLGDLKLIYIKHGLDWHGTSKAIIGTK